MYKRQLLDRKKDLIKSGGEWISSVQLEEIARTHPMIHNAAVIGVTHKKWSERPIIIVELVKETHPNEGEILAFFKGKVVKWQIPDAVIFVDEIPLSSTGKPLKKVLKNKYINYNGWILTAASLPFLPVSRSKLIFAPSFNVFIPAASTADICTKTSFAPPSGSIKP